MKIQLALVYPLILLVASFSIVGFLLGYVVPDVVKIFINSGQPLPVLTQAMIAISNGLRSYGALLFIVLLVACGATRWALRQPRLKLRWHVLLLSCAGGRGAEGNGSSTVRQHPGDTGQKCRTTGGCPGNFGHGHQ